MDVQSQLLFIGSSADMNRNYGGRTEEVRGLGKITSTPEGVPLPSYRNGRRLGVTQEYPSDGITLMRSFTTVRDDRLAM